MLLELFFLFDILVADADGIPNDINLTLCNIWALTLVWSVGDLPHKVNVNQDMLLKKSQVLQVVTVYICLLSGGII